jgi:hypothetical protein
MERESEAAALRSAALPHVPLRICAVPDTTALFRDDERGDPFANPANPIEPCTVPPREVKDRLGLILPFRRFIPIKREVGGFNHGSSPEMRGGAASSLIIGQSRRTLTKEFRQAVLTCAKNAAVR